MQPSDQWSAITRATVSFGAGVAVSPLQMAAVYAAIANGGTCVQPSLVRGNRRHRRRCHAGASVADATASCPPRTSKQLTEMLAYAVQDGTGTAAQIAGYQVAGKTGTAQEGRQRRQVHRSLRGLVHRVPAGLAAEGRDRGDPRRARHGVRRRRGGPAVPARRAVRDPAARDRGRARPSRCRRTGWPLPESPPGACRLARGEPDLPPGAARRRRRDRRRRVRRRPRRHQFATSSKARTNQAT